MYVAGRRGARGSSIEPASASQISAKSRSMLALEGKSAATICAERASPTQGQSSERPQNWASAQRGIRGEGERQQQHEAGRPCERGKRGEQAGQQPALTLQRDAGGDGQQQEERLGVGGGQEHARGEERQIDECEARDAHAKIAR